MTSSKKAEDKSEVLVLVLASIFRMLWASQNLLCFFQSTLNSVFSAVSYSDIFFLWKGVSKSIDLLKIYVLIGQYFLILLLIWVSRHFPAHAYLLFDFLVLRMEMLKKTSNCALLRLRGFALGPNEGSGEVADSLAPFQHPGCRARFWPS